MQQRLTEDCAQVCDIAGREEMGNCCSTSSYDEATPINTADGQSKNGAAVVRTGRKGAGQRLGGETTAPAANKDPKLEAREAAERRQQTQNARLASGKLGRQLAEGQKTAANRRTEAHINKPTEETGLNMRWD